MRVTALFFIVASFTNAYAGVKYCKIGADPVNTNRHLRKGEHFDYLPSGTIVKMKTGSGSVVVCKLQVQEKVSFSRNGIPRWISFCGNPILGVRLISLQAKKAQDSLRLEDWEKRMLFTDTSAPMMQQISECGAGTECWARAQQFKVNFDIGVGAQWIHHTGLPDYSVSYSQNQNATGGQGGNGYGGQGGGGGSSSSSSSSTVNTTPTTPTPNPGGPVNPGPANPNPGGPVNPGAP